MNFIIMLLETAMIRGSVNRVLLKQVDFQLYKEKEDLAKSAKFSRL